MPYAASHGNQYHQNGVRLGGYSQDLPAALALRVAGRLAGSIQIFAEMSHFV
jgi:hypothetical protein